MQGFDQNFINTIKRQIISAVKENGIWFKATDENTAQIITILRTMHSLRRGQHWTPTQLIEGVLEYARRLKGVVDDLEEEEEMDDYYGDPEYEVDVYDQEEIDENYRIWLGNSIRAAFGWKDTN